MAEQVIDFSVLTRDAETTHFAAGDVIFHAGNPPGDMYLVKSGEVQLKLGDRVLETLGPNGIFGEMGLIDHQPRSATAVAGSDTELVPLGEKQFLFLVSETPYFALNVMRVMSRRLRNTAAAAQA